MESTQTLLILVLVFGVCQSHSFNFKSLLHNVVPAEVKEKVATDLKHLKLKLPDSLSGLKIHPKAEDLGNLKPALKEVERKLPADLQRLATNLQDGSSDLHANLKGVDENLKPILKGLEKELFKDLKIKGVNGTCGCAEYKCSCCEHFTIKKIKLDDSVCVAVAYLKQAVGVEFTLTVDGKTYLRKEISARNPPPFCIGIPHLEKEASICIRFRNLNIDKVNKKVSGCVSLVVRLKLVISEEIPIGCFNMPIKGAQTTDNTDNKTQISKEEKMEMLSRLGLMGKTFSNGRLINQNLLKN